MIKKKSFAFRAIVLLVAYLLSACGASGLQGADSQEQFVEESQTQDVAYTGVIEAISGSQWIINGVEVTVEPSVIQGGPFIVGDTVKVEGMVRSDGVLVVVRVESPTAADLSGLPGLGDSVDTVADDDNNNSNNTNGDDDDNTNGNTNGDDDDDDNTNGNVNINTNDDDDDDDDNTNSNANTNGDDDDDDDNNNSNTNGDDDDDDNNNNNTNGDDDDDDNSNGS